ncbi:MAG: hypothetical protein AB2748_18240 [Candidatus Thiodiazotropha endolucinida]
MKTKSKNMIVGSITLVVAAVLSSPSIVFAAQPNPGTDDCYNRCSNTCNERGGDWGDKSYRDCITSCLDWCDKNEPPSIGVMFPVLDSSGRFSKASPEKEVEAGTVNININLRAVQ